MGPQQKWQRMKIRKAKSKTSEHYIKFLSIKPLGGKKLTQRIKGYASRDISSVSI